MGPTTYVEPRSYVRGYSTYGSTPTYAKAKRKRATADWMFNDVEEVRDAVMGKGQYWTDDQKLASDTEDDLNNELNKLKKTMGRNTRPVLLRVPADSSKHTAYETIEEAIEHLQDISSEEIPSDTTTDYVSAPREIAIPS